jgi:hypothetical protein
MRLVQGDHCARIADVELDAASSPLNLCVAKTTQQRDELWPGKCHLLVEQFGEQLFIFGSGAPCV